MEDEFRNTSEGQTLITIPARQRKHHIVYTACIVFLLGFLAAVNGVSQTPPTAPTQTSPGTPSSDTTRLNASERGCPMEGLNYLGSYAKMPAFDDSVIPEDSAFRQVPCKYGWAVRLNLTPEYKENMLQAPVGPSKATYTGQSMFWYMSDNPEISWDMRQLHLHHAQLQLGLIGENVEWQPGGPSSLGVLSLYFYQDYFKDRLEVKGGYMVEHWEFMGLQVGGSIATNSLGVYSVMPYQLGMSHNGQASPAFNARVNLPHYLYSKTGIQRTLDPLGGNQTNVRNPTGLIFTPHGYKELIIEEVGIDRHSNAKNGQLWIRGGYMNNRTPYTNKVTGKAAPGNELGYVLADYQVWQKDTRPAHGLYIGGTFEKSPSYYNANEADYEVRTYLKAPFRSRPYDQTSLVLAYSPYSSDTVRAELAKHTSHSADATSATYSYGLRAYPGVYFNMGISYLEGETNTPRVRNALLGTMVINIFF